MWRFANARLRQGNNCCRSFADAEETVAQTATKFIFFRGYFWTFSQSVIRDRSTSSTVESKSGPVTQHYGSENIVATICELHLE